MSKHSQNHKHTLGNAESSQESQPETVPEMGENTAAEQANAEHSSTEQASADMNSGAPETIEQKYEGLKIKYAELNDQYLRKAADFENFRKRMNKEKQEIVEFSNQTLLLDLLPVIDDFERAIKSAQTSQDFTGFYEGITMIEKRLSTELENKWGLKRFDSEGEPFDPNRHEALQMEKAEGIQEAVVKDDFVKGYLLRDRVIRFAKVKVLVPAENGESGTGNE